jgi:tetratricopeptide (TPR) repeat protein
MSDAAHQPGADLASRCSALEASIAKEPLQAAQGLAELAEAAGVALLPAMQVRAERARARALAYAGQYDASLVQARACAERARHHGLLEECARAQLAAMHSLVETGRLDEALAEGHAARTTLLTRGDAALLARADINLGIVLQRQAKLVDALERFDAAAPALEAEPLVLGQLENNRGETLLRLFRFDEARASFVASHQANLRAGARLTAAIAQGNVADLEARRGDLAAAIRQFQAAIDLIEPLGAPGHLLRLRAEHAETLAAGGLCDDACRAFHALIPELDGAGLRREAARARAGLGRALAHAGQDSEARTALAAAHAEFVALSDSIEAARVSLDHADVLLRAGDHAAVRMMVQRALGSLVSRGLDRARAELMLAACARHERHHDEALAHVAMARALAQGIRPFEALADLEEAATLRAAGEPARALVPARRAAMSLESIRTALPARRLRLAYADAAAAHACALGLLLESGGSAGDLIEAIEAIDARASTDATVLGGPETDSRSADVVRRVSLGRDLNALYSMLADAGAGDARHAAWREECARLEQAIDALDLRIETGAGERSGRVRRASAGDVPSLLAPGEVVIRFGVHCDEIVCAMVARDGSHVARALGSACELERLVRALHFRMRRAALDAAPNDASTANELLRRIDALLGRTLRSAMERFGEHAIVVPAGAAALVPFHALPSLQVPGGVVTTAPSMGMLASALTMKSIDRPARVLSVGVSDDAIPGAAREARQVAATWNDAQTACLTDGEATTTAVRSALPAADLIHLASHGWFAPTTHEASGLRMADRWLHRRELRDVALSADLVVLSGCETGPGGSGGDAHGLFGGFLAAGARRVLASLWTVRDEICVEFMAGLHARWHSEGLGGVSRAWAEQVEAVRSEHPHPAHWAPFMLSGAHR